MSLHAFAAGLSARARMIGWTTRDDPTLAADGFSHRHPLDDGRLPAERLGLWLGAYPVILSPIELGGPELMETQLRALHAQVLVARSHVKPPRHIVDMHLFLLLRAKRPSAEEAAAIDKLERDEAVCRKLVCTYDDDLPAATAAFIERTFLARPWDAIPKAKSPKAKSGFQLDQPASLVTQILVEKGLTPPAAEAWVRLAEAYDNDERAEPSDLVAQLVAAMEATDD